MSEYAKTVLPNFHYLSCTLTIEMSEHHLWYLFFNKLTFSSYWLL